MAEIDTTDYISQSAINRASRTIVQSVVGVGAAWLVTHGVGVTMDQELAIIAVGGSALTALLSYVQHRYLDHIDIPLVNLLRPPEHPAVTLQKAAGTVDVRLGDPGDTDLPEAAPAAPAGLPEPAAVPDVSGKDAKPVHIGPDGRPG